MIVVRVVVVGARPASPAQLVPVTSPQPAAQLGLSTSLTFTGTTSRITSHHTLHTNYSYSLNHIYTNTDTINNRDNCPDSVREGVDQCCVGVRCGLLEIMNGTGGEESIHRVM